MKKLFTVILIITQTLIFSAFLGHAEMENKESRISNDENPIRSPILHIESLTLSDQKPMIGKTLNLLSTIRNVTKYDLDGATFQFYQDDRKLGSPIVIDHIESGSEISIELPFRPSSVGRYTIKAVVTPSLESATDSPSNLLFKGEIKDLTFIIKALPSWWLRLNRVLEETKVNTLTNYSRMEGLDDNSLCQNDVQFHLVLQQYGQSFLDAVSSQNDVQEKVRFTDALYQLSKFTEMLYCIDLPRLQYWDRAIANFWKDIMGKSENNFTFNEAILATWNPALLVVDAIQHTGYSEIINTYQDFAPYFEKTLKSYPAETFGAAWLDVFGEGLLVRTSGNPALKNLQQVLADPQLLGFGTCSLAAHAQKMQIDLPCFHGFDQIAADCAATDLSGILQELNKANMLLPLIQGNLAAASSSKSNTGSPSSVTLKIEDLNYFGRGVYSYISDLCLKLDKIKPFNLRSMLPEMFREHLSYLSGCGFAMLMEGLSGAGGEIGGRITKCFEERSSHIPSSPIQEAQVSFPIPECAYGQDQKTDFEKYKEMLEGQNIKVRKNDDGSITISNEQSDGQGGVDQNSWAFSSTGRLISSHSENIDKNGTLKSTTDTKYRANGTEITTRQEYHDNGSKETITARYPDGRRQSWTTQRNEGGNAIGKTKVKKDRWKKKKPYKAKTRRPTEPGEDGCGETAAMQRAKVFFNCIFYDPTIDSRGVPIPRPLGPEGGLPVACDSIDSASFWGSSTSSKGGAYDPPWWDLGGGGPSKYQKFIPRIHGVIDPPKDWKTIPRGGNLHDLPE